MRAIIRPFKNAERGKIIYCIKMDISTLTLKILYNCIKAFKCI